MINPKEIITTRPGAIYKVPFYKITSEGLTDADRSPCPFHFVKGNREDETVFRQEGFVTETLLAVCKKYLEDNNVGDLRSDETSSAIMYIEKALECIDARAAKRKAAGVQGTYRPTPESRGHIGAELTSTGEAGIAVTGEPEGPEA